MITVIHPGIYSSIQDMGRTGYANVGVPISGVMDSYSVKIGNQLLLNEINDAVIEITNGGAKFQFEKTVQICITGADFNAKIDANPIAMNTIVEIKKGAVLIFGKREKGIRTYLCVQGGIRTSSVLNSKSFYKEITKSARLKKGDQLSIGEPNSIVSSRNAKVKVAEDHFTANTILCLKGPEYELLSKSEQNKLLNHLFTISKDNNRMGYRLEEKVENNLKSIFTSGVLPGTVQLTPSGKLLVLMRDCQVTGGYPRVLQLTEESINRLAQKSTREQIQFVLK